MSDTSQAIETTAERKPPTLADIVREKTDDGKRIIDFFLDVMEDRVDGAELCHRIDAAKQLEKHKSKAAARFIARYKGVPCGHSTGGRPDPADPCSAEERSLVAVTLNAPATLTRDFLTVLSGIDEFLMARLIRAQTADGVTVIEFLDDVMQDRVDGFKTHHRIAAAKELIVHIVRDEHPSHTPSPSTTPSPLTGEGWGEGDSPVVGADPRVRPLPGSQTPSPLTGEGWGEGDSPVVPAQAEGNPDNTIVVPAKAGTQGRGGGRNTAANPARTEPVPSTAEGSVHPEPSSPVIPAKAGIQRGGGRNTAANPAHLEPAEGPRDKARRPRTRRTRTQRRRDGNARAAIRRKALGSERIEEGKDEKPAPAELTIAERRIKERLGCVDICIILDICQQLHFRRNNGQRCLSSFAGSPGCTSDGKPNVSGSSMLCYGLRGLGHNGGCCHQSTVNGTASTSDSPAGVTTEYGSVSISISSMTPTWNTSSSTVRSSGHILRRLGHPKKRGQASQALGRSRGGFSTKIHVSVDGLGNPLRFTLTGGQEHDVTQANELIAGMESEYVIADRAYDSNQFLESVIEGGAVPVIPPRSNRTEPHSYDTYLYRERHLVECLIGKIKHFRRIFSRFDKLANRYLGFLHFVGAIIWLR